MWIRMLLAVFVVFSAGLITAAGYFAVISSVGVITRFADNTKTARYMGIYERVLIGGVTIGNIFIVFAPPVRLGLAAGAISAFFGGAFVGCFLVSLAEVVKGIPIFMRRSKLTVGLVYIIMSLALGKGFGSIIYFLFYVGR